MFQLKILLVLALLTPSITFLFPFFPDPIKITTPSLPTTTEDPFCFNGCENYGKCISYRDDKNCTKCLCPLGYNGDCCDMKLNSLSCSSNPCGSEGNWECVDLGFNGFQCSCEAGYTGVKCDKLIDTCTSVGPCFNYDQCHVQGIDFQCICKDGFFGQQCERYSNCTVEHCSCNTVNLCKNGGTCIEGLNGKYQCLCPQNISGIKCEILDPCKINPCKHGGICSANADGTTKCTCSNIWTGDFCEMFDICKHKSCKNGGICSRRNDDEFNCQCPCGFTGVECEVAINPCDPNPCKWDGVCSNLTCDYICDCPAAANGKSCEIKPNNCEVNGYPTVCKKVDKTAECEDLLEGFRCNCSSEFTGKDCDTSMIVWRIVQELGGAEVDVMDLLEEVATNPSLIKDIVPFIVGQESPEKQTALSWNHEDLFLWASFEGSELDIQKQMFKWYDITLGNCFTFNHKNSTKHFNLRQAGENGGFKALMKLQQQEYLSWINTAALLVFVHTMEEKIFQESVRYQIASGVHGTIMPNKITYKRLCGKYGDCITDSSKVKAHYYPGSYTTNGCLRGCYQDAVQKDCNCMDPRYARPATASSCSLSSWKCVANVTKMKGDASNWKTCHCPAPCEESQYESHYTFGSALSNPIECSKLTGADKFACLESYKDLAMISVYVPKLTHKVFSESPKMSFNQFISSVGGMAGVVIGFSVVSIVDFGFLFVLLGRVLSGFDK